MRRLLAVLDAFDRRSPGLSLTAISERIGLPLATTHRPVGVLVEWGALERDEEPGTYHVGLKLWLLPGGIAVREQHQPDAGGVQRPARPDRRTRCAPNASAPR